MARWVLALVRLTRLVTRTLGISSELERLVALGLFKSKHCLCNKVVLEVNHRTLVARVMRLVVNGILSEVLSKTLLGKPP